jgi:ribonuclease-3
VINLLLKKIRLFSNARKEPYLLFYNILGFYPDSIEYYQLAVRHRSASVSVETGLSLSNERLEFLGDAVLNSVVTDILYRKYANQTEGFLTNTRSKIVKRESLNRLAFEIGLDKLMLTSKQVNTSTNNNNIYGNALEALMGAIYLDYGYKKCKLFFETRLLNKFIDIDKLANGEANFKSKIIEWSQKHRIPIEFILVNEELQSANKHIFHTQLSIAGTIISESTGSSKKESQQNAAYLALNQIQSNPRFIEDLVSNKPDSLIS